MICSELLKPHYASIEADFTRYKYSHPDIRELISGWFKRAQEMRDCQGRECFEAFFFTWIAFNGWAACVTDKDIDAAYVDALIRNSQLCRDFEKLTADGTSRLALASKQFASLWPIFDTKNLRELGLYDPRRSREDTIRYYVEKGASLRALKCWKSHKDAGQTLPIDWPHTLSALYQVRCNFFHGGKMLNSEGDQQIVATAYMTLLTFLEQIDYLG